MSLEAIKNNALNNGASVNLNGMGSVSQAAENAAAENEVSKSAVSSSVAREDAFVKSKDLEKSDSGIYSRESILEMAKQDQATREKQLQEMISGMIADQGQTVNLTIGDLKLHVTEEQSAKAKEAISEGGEYSVEKVAGRIMDFAKALAGDDPSKIDELQKAVIKGFEGAAGILGKKKLDDMPEITKQTYDNVMKQFDDWKKSYDTETTKNTVAKEVSAQAVTSQIAKAPENNIGVQTEAAMYANA